MCMYTRDPKERVNSGGDIWCVKIVEYVEGPDGREHAVTPFMFKRIPEECLTGLPFKPDPVDPDPDPVDPGQDDSLIPIDPEITCIEGGYIHTYGELPVGYMASDLYWLCSGIGRAEEYISKAKGEAVGCGQNPTVNGVGVWLCRIPCGAKYIRGYNNNGTDEDCVSYVSDRIEFVKEMHRFTESDFDGRMIAGDVYSESVEKAFREKIAIIKREFESYVNDNKNKED